LNNPCLIVGGYPPRIKTATARGQTAQCV